MSDGSSGPIDEVSVRDAIAALLVRVVDPLAENIDWPHVAATIYTTTGALLSPEEVAALYFQLLAKHQGRGALERAVAAARVGAVNSVAVRRVTGEPHPLAETLSGISGCDAEKASSSVGAGRGASATGKFVVIGAHQNAAVTAAAAAGGGAAVGSESRRQPVLLRHDPIDSVATSSTLRAEQLLDLLNRCRAISTSEIFWEPLAPRTMMLHSNQTLGPYCDVVAHPMSFSVMQSRIVSGEVQSLDQFRALIWLIAANCVMFNAPEGGYPAIAREFAEAADAVIDSYTSGIPAKRQRI